MSAPARRLCVARALLGVLGTALVSLAGCGGEPATLASDDASVDGDAADLLDDGGDTSASADGASGPPLDGTGLDGTGVDGADSEAPDRFTDPLAAGLRVVTFNSGTGGGAGDPETNQGYGDQQAEWNDEFYGSGLAWWPFVEDVTGFFADLDADIVAFQEIFWPGECPGIPVEAHVGFVCDTWEEGEPTVAERVLGEGWQVACHWGKPDKCVGVRRSVGTFRGCDGDLCLDGLFGTRVDDCGSGARVARGVIDLVGGGELTLVSFHGSSGFSDEEAGCRVAQIDQVFVDIGDGEPGANGSRNLILGDLNTDPGRFGGGDASADRWWDFVGDGQTFHFVTDVGEGARASYGGFFNIDHVLSDSLDGDCWIAGETPGHDAPTASVFFDHRPIVCDVIPLGGAR